MPSPKLYANLKQLSAKTLDRFTLYLKSPVHNVHRETWELWQALRAQFPEFAIADEALYAAAFPEKPYDNARLRVLRTYLVEHLESFLILGELEMDGVLRNRLLRRAADRYGLEFIRKEAWESIAGPIHWDAELAMEEFWLAQHKLQKDVRRSNRSLSHDLKAVLQPLDSFYWITRLKYYCALADPMTRKEPLLEGETIREVTELFSALALEAQPLAMIYFHLLLLLLGKDPSIHLPILKGQLKEFQSQIDAHECLNIYTYWFNFLNHQYQIGSPTAVRDMFELYKEMIGLEAMFQEGSFAANHFRNIVMIAAMLKEFDWAHAFLDNYHSRLQLPWRTGVYAYCKGYLLFATGHYADAKRQLLGVEFYDPEYKINHQMLFIRIYYETNDLDGIEAVRDALKIFLHRNTAIPAASKASANNFARFALRLFHLRGILLPRKGIEKLRKEMDASQQLRDRNWLNAKLAEIEGK